MSADNRDALLADIIKRECKFVGDLDNFIVGFIKPLFNRDTPFKRQMLEDPYIGACLNLYIDIYAACQLFLSSLQEASTDAQIADAISQFAPSLSIFSQYLTEVTSAINSLSKFGRPLFEYASGCLATGTTVENELLALQQHYAGYRELITQLVFRTPPGNEGMADMATALKIFEDACDMVDARIDDETVKVQLLLLQQQCKFNLLISTYLIV